MRLVVHSLLALAVVSTAAAQARGPSFRGLGVAADGTVWASGTGGAVLRSADGGKTWESKPVTDAASFDLRDVEAVSATTAYVMVAGSDTARIYKTTDGGANWTRQYDDTRKGVFLDGLAFWDATHGVAIGDPMDGRFLILRTEDGGAHWTPLADAPAALRGEAVFAASGTTIIAGPGGLAWIGTGGVLDGAKAGRVLRSTDYGRTWTAIDTPLPSGTASTGIFSLAFRDASRGVAVGGDYAAPKAPRPNVAVTTDGGQTWQLADSARATTYLSGAAFVPKGKEWVVVAVGTEGTFRSADDGRTWTRVDAESRNVVAAHRDAIVAAGDRGTSIIP